MSLIDTFDRMDIEKRAAYDGSTGCLVDRDENGDIALTMDHGGRSVTHTLADLLRGPCRGMRGAALENGIREAMEGFLAAAADNRAIEEDA